MKQQVDYETARSYLRKVREVSGQDFTKIARAIGVAPSTITGFMSASPRTQTIRIGTLRLVEKRYGIPLPVELLAAASPALPAISPPSRDHDVPIYALIGSETDGGFYYLNEIAIDYALRPAGISHATRAYALRMPDESMDGWRRVNELVYVDPMRAVADGDHALIEFANRVAPNNPGIFAIRRVLRRGAKDVLLGTWGLNPSETKVRRTDILTYRRILEWPELLGLS